jgi:hypothetical protein
MAAICCIGSELCNFASMVSRNALARAGSLQLHDGMWSLAAVEEISPTSRTALPPMNGSVSAVSARLVEQNATGEPRIGRWHLQSWQVEFEASLATKAHAVSHRLLEHGDNEEENIPDWKMYWTPTAVPHSFGTRSMTFMRNSGSFDLRQLRT